MQRSAGREGWRSTTGTVAAHASGWLPRTTRLPPGSIGTRGQVGEMHLRARGLRVESREHERRRALQAGDGREVVGRGVGPNLEAPRAAQGASRRRRGSAPYTSSQLRAAGRRASPVPHSGGGRGPPRPRARRRPRPSAPARSRARRLVVGTDGMAGAGLDASTIETERSRAHRADESRGQNELSWFARNCMYQKGSLRTAASPDPPGACRRVGVARSIAAASSAWSAPGERVVGRRGRRVAREHGVELALEVGGQLHRWRRCATARPRDLGVDLADRWSSSSGLARSSLTPCHQSTVSGIATMPAVRSGFITSNSTAARASRRRRRRRAVDAERDRIGAVEQRDAGEVERRPRPRRRRTAIGAEHSVLVPNRLLAVFTS